MHTESAPRAAAAGSADEAVAETVAAVARLLRSRGERMTAARRAVLSVLARSADHVSAETVVSRIAEVDPGVHRASVYRTLDALTALGVVHHVHMGRGGTAYHLVQGEPAHLHAQCRVCSAVVDLPGDLLDGVGAEVERRFGFHVEPGHVALSGVCDACLQDPEAGAHAPH